MHEASLVEGILRLALKSLADYCREHPGETSLRIGEIVCSAGLLAGIENEAMRACFEIFAEGTPAENARLTIRTAPLKCRCEICGEEFYLGKRRFICPACAGDAVSFEGGGGVVLEAINVERGEKQDD